MITPTEHEKAEWSRLATAAYRADLNAVGHRYSAAAALGHGERIDDTYFDELQRGYRAWLVGGFSMAPPTFVDRETAYGTTVRMSRSIKVF